MYSVRFCGLKRAIKAFQKACPNIQTFTSIHGNVYEDFVIKCDNDSYIVRSSDFSVWHLEGGDWRTGKWIKVS